MPNWKVGLNIDRYIRYGYLMQDERGSFTWIGEQGQKWTRKR